MDLKICRICGGVNELKNIMEQGAEMIDKLLVCANINVQNPEDLLPKLICQKCDEHLDLSFRLRKQSEATQKRLRLEIERKQYEKAGANLNDSNEVEFMTENNIDKQNQNNGVAFNKTADYTFETSTNLEQQINEKEILIEDCDDNDRSYIEFYMEHSEDKEKIQEYTKDPIPLNFYSIDLLSSSSRSSIDESLVGSKVNFLTCGTCSQVFTKKKEYSNHIKLHGKERYQCIQCCKFFSSRFRLKRHEEIHNDILSYQCSYCKRSYRALYNLNRHVQSAHLGKKSWECDICNVSFARLDVLKRHLELHSDEKKYKCLLCEQSFKTRDYLYAHNKSYHTTNTGESKTIRRAKTNESNKHQCGYCGKLFKSSFTYKNHLLIHTNEKPHECESCRKKFRTIAALSIHQRIHDDYRPYQCDLCLKSFRQTSHLKEHKLLHTNIVPQHICSICQTSFVKKSNLKAHMRIHNQEKLFKCADCSAEFSFMHLLQRHASKIHNRSVHKVYTANDTDELPEADDSVNNSGALESEEYHYIDTVVDDDDDDADDDNKNFCHNNADVIDLVNDDQEIHISSPELEIINDELVTEQDIIDDEKFISIDSELTNDYIARHSFDLMQQQSNEEDVVENIINDESHIVEQKFDIFVSEDTKLTSCMYNISRFD